MPDTEFPAELARITGGVFVAVIRSVSSVISESMTNFVTAVSF